MDISRIVHTAEIFKPDLIGTTINYLHIFKYVGYIKNTRPRKHCFLCKCECGNEICLPYISIKKRGCGCGCKHKKMADLFYKKFGRLTVIEYAGYKKINGHRWRCQCECGNSTTVFQWALLLGTTVSCSCLKQEVLSRNHKSYKRADNGKIKESLTVEFKAFCAMKSRCNNKNGQDYKWYAARGIQCKFTSYEEFLNEVGRRPSNKHSIDRIDNDKGYEPGNVRWATTVEQNNNKRTTVFLTYKNRKLPISRWAKLLGVKYVTFIAQYRNLKNDTKTVEYYLKKKGLDYASLQG